MLQLRLFQDQTCGIFFYGRQDSARATAPEKNEDCTLMFGSRGPPDYFFSAELASQSRVTLHPCGVLYWHERSHWQKGKAQLTMSSLLPTLLLWDRNFSYC